MRGEICVPHAFLPDFILQDRGLLVEILENAQNVFVEGPPD